ncbi:hypothetical protein GCM10023169_09060 [Georgenia halophila]|uniref:Signal peptidase I n=1 Tax=Georgenia halophila TaxID=620889 RepID=A0ABP8L002_9MICO
MGSHAAVLGRARSADPADESRPGVAALGWAGRVLAWVVILGAVAILAAAVVVPRAAGATPYTVTTGSMEPALPPGTLVVVRPVPHDQIGVGDVITYQLESGEPAVATHRVVAVGTDMTGAYRYTTRGDANDADDRTPVRSEQIRGRLWYAVPYLGHVSTVLTGEQRVVGRTVGAGLLLAYAGYMFVGAVRDRRRRKPGEEGS